MPFMWSMSNAKLTNYIYFNLEIMNGNKSNRDVFFQHINEKVIFSIGKFIYNNFIYKLHNNVTSK